MLFPPHQSVHVISFTRPRAQFAALDLSETGFGLSLNPSSIVMFEGASGCGYRYHHFGTAAVKGRHEVLIAEKSTTGVGQPTPFALT